MYRMNKKLIKYILDEIKKMYNIFICWRFLCKLYYDIHSCLCNSGSFTMHLTRQNPSLKKMTRYLVLDAATLHPVKFLLWNACLFKHGTWLTAPELLCCSLRAWSGLTSSRLNTISPRSSSLLIFGTHCESQAACYTLHVHSEWLVS